MNSIELYRNKDHIILIAAIEFFKLKDIVRFTKKEQSNWSEGSENLDHEIQYYQRETNIKRVNELIKHINKTLLSESNNQVLFPSSLILSTEYEIDDFNTENGIVNFNIPKEKESCLIVDGQHRLKAMKLLFDDLDKFPDENEFKITQLNNYKFNCTILINYDLWEQAKIFASVNFNQKPVDRSLYYDIFGEVPKDGGDEKMSNLYIAHELGKFLNRSEKSPLRGFVKNFTYENGFISQSFLTEAILGILGPRSSWNYVVDDYTQKGTLHKKLPKVFVGYFNAIRECFFDYWPLSTNKSDSTILTKTTALGAFIKLLGWTDRILKLELFPDKNRLDLLDLSQEEITKLFTEIFNKLNIEKNNENSISEKLFGKNSKYLGGGSVGLQNELFRELSKAIGIEYDRKRVNSK
jgi:DGQHR domain-containing protein